MPQTTQAQQSCESCHRRRRKCDRRAPVCSTCEKRKDECVYDATLDQRRPAQKNYVAVLEARIALLEGILRDAGVSDVAGSSRLTPTEEGRVYTARAASSASPIGTTQPKPEPISGYRVLFVPPDDITQAFVPIALPSLGKFATTASDELDLGMSSYVPLVSLDMEHKLLAQFWDWQRLHVPYVAPVPFLSAYALYARVAHPGEPTPPSPPTLPPNLYACPSTMVVPSADSVCVTPELAQFISPLLLDAIFVVGALFCGNTEMSNQFYKRAETRVIREAANPRLATVQGMMMMVMAELGHARAPAAWTLNGAAIALCFQLGMHINATPLVRCGTMSKTLFETRNFVFWTLFSTDRFYSTCLGMHPLMNRHVISTPRPSALAAVNLAKSAKPGFEIPVVGLSSAPAERSAAPDVDTTWWCPAPLGMKDANVQMGWEAIRDLAQVLDTLYDGIYAFGAPKRTPQEDLELVARNNLIIHRFVDGLPTLLRSTDVIGKKDNCVVYLHLFIHLGSIITCRPFLSPRPLSEDAMHLDVTTDISQPTDSSHLTRRYRTLAFHVARASALQITSLLRHIPLSSPCVTIPYIVFSACTILLLTPNDAAAMDGVRTSVACLENIHQTGYWARSAKDTKERILALARRWGVNIGMGNKAGGPVSRGRGREDGDEPGVPSTGEGDDAAPGLDAESHNVGPIDVNGGVQEILGSSSSTRSASQPVGGIEDTGVMRPSASTGTHDEKDEHSATHCHILSDWIQRYEDDPPAQIYANQEYSEGITTPSNHGCTALLPQENSTPVASNARYATIVHSYSAGERISDSHSNTSGLMYADEPADGPAYAPQEQAYSSTRPVDFETQTYGARDHYSIRTYSGVADYEHQVQYRNDLVSASQQQVYQQHHYHRPLSKQQQPTHSEPQLQYQSPRPRALPPTQHYHIPAPPAPLRHVAYALSHAEPVHDFHLPHIHRHQVLPSTDPNFSSSPDPVACVDLAGSFAHTIQTVQEEPAFVRSPEDPYASIAVDWLADVACSFPAMTMETYADSGGASRISTGKLRTGVSGEAGRSYEYRYPAYGYDREGYVSGYRDQDM